jgi:hypothetical protein
MSLIITMSMSNWIKMVNIRLCGLMLLQLNLLLLLLLLLLLQPNNVL